MRKEGEQKTLQVGCKRQMQPSVRDPGMASIAAGTLCSQTDLQQHARPESVIRTPVSGKATKKRRIKYV